MFTRKKFGHTKYTREKILDPQNTHEKKIRTHEIPTRKIFGPTKDPREKFWTHEILTRKNDKCIEIFRLENCIVR